MRIPIAFIITLFTFSSVFGQDSSQANIDSIQSTASLPSTSPRSTFGKFAKSLVLPTLLFSAGAYSIQYRYDVVDWRRRNYAKFRTHADDYMQYAPLVAMYALTWSERPRGTPSEAWTRSPGRQKAFAGASDAPGRVKWTIRVTDDAASLPPRCRRRSFPPGGSRHRHQQQS